MGRAGFKPAPTEWGAPFLPPPCAGGLLWKGRECGEVPAFAGTTMEGGSGRGEWRGEWRMEGLLDAELSEVGV